MFAIIPYKPILFIKETPTKINNYIFELLPNEIIQSIIEYISIRDFINFTMTCKYLSEFTSCKKIPNFYKLSKIEAVKNKYKFTKIFYDYKIFQAKNIPISVKRISFDDKFNRPINGLNILINLKAIHVSSIFSHIESITNIPDKIINKYGIIIETMVNNLNEERLKLIYNELINNLTDNKLV